jgi:hypothetical protein
MRWAHRHLCLAQIGDEAEPPPGAGRAARLSAGQDSQLHLGPIEVYLPERMLRDVGHGTEADVIPALRVGLDSRHTERRAGCRIGQQVRGISRRNQVGVPVGEYVFGALGGGDDRAAGQRADDVRDGLVPGCG